MFILWLDTQGTNIAVDLFYKVKFVKHGWWSCRPYLRHLSVFLILLIERSHKATHDKNPTFVRG